MGNLACVMLAIYFLTDAKIYNFDLNINEHENQKEEKRIAVEN